VSRVLHSLAADLLLPGLTQISRSLTGRGAFKYKRAMTRLLAKAINSETRTVVILTHQDLIVVFGIWPELRKDSCKDDRILCPGAVPGTPRIEHQDRPFCVGI
jgi:hypothetical protein